MLLPFLLRSAAARGLPRLLLHLPRMAASATAFFLSSIPCPPRAPLLRVQFLHHYATRRSGPPPCPSPLTARSEDGDSRCDDVGSSRTGFTGPSDLQPCHRYSLDDLLLLFSSPCSLTASVDFTLGLALQVRLSVVMPIMSLCIMASSESGRGPARGYLGYCNEM